MTFSQMVSMTFSQMVSMTIPLLVLDSVCSDIVNLFVKPNTLFTTENAIRNSNIVFAAKSDVAFCKDSAYQPSSVLIASKL